MSNVIACDFESYFDREISLKKMGVHEYLDHPDTDIYLISMYSEDENGNTTIDYSGPLENAPWTKINGAHCVAHHSYFDQAVFDRAKEKGQIPENINPEKWSCTAELAVYLGAPRSLLGASKQLLNMKISKSYRKTALAKRWDDFTDQEKVEIMEAGKSDAYTCFMLWKHFNDKWPAFEQKVAQINRAMGRRGMRVDKEALEAAITTVEDLLFEAGKEIPWNWGGSRSKTPLLAKEIAQECRNMGIPCPTSFAKDSEDFQEWVEDYGDRYQWIGALNTWRKGGAFLSKLKTIQRRIREDGTMPTNLKYFGAMTGRFSGTDGFNFQNMPRGKTFGIDLRHMFIPRENHILLIADWSQIESRIISWSIGDEATLEMIREGISPYEAHARATMDWTGGKLKDEDPDLYALAKARVLALGYGAGSVRFQGMAKTYCNLDLTPAECKQTVDHFRATNPKLLQQWDMHHREMSAAARTASREYRVDLPTGRKLRYFKVNFSEGLMASTERGGTSYHFYGAKVFQHRTQATAREILAEAMVAVEEEMPYAKQCVTVHDELVLDVPLEYKDEAKTIIEDIMTRSPKWAPDLPLGLDWMFAEHYQK